MSEGIRPVDPFVALGPVSPYARVALVDHIEVGDCWQWTGRFDQDGYGRFGNRGLYAHRLVWESLVGLIPPGRQIDHICRNRGCVNPDHLEVVTLQENISRTPPGMKGQHSNHSRGADHLNSQKTHCPYGHPYSPENTACSARGTRLCLACRKIRNRKTSQKRTAQRRLARQQQKELL